jgi:hypothetical protein
MVARFCPRPCRGRACRRRPPARSAAVIVRLIATVACMFLVDTAASNWARGLPQWFDDVFEREQCGKRGSRRTGSGSLFTGCRPSLSCLFSLHCREYYLLGSSLCSETSDAISGRPNGWSRASILYLFLGKPLGVVRVHAPALTLARYMCSRFDGGEFHALSTHEPGGHAPGSSHPFSGDDQVGTRIFPLVSSKQTNSVSAIALLRANGN